MFSYSNALGGDRKKLGRTIAAVLAATLILSACDEQDSADQFLTRAQEYRDKGDLQASIIEAKNALRANRDDQDARYILGSNYLDLGDWISAEATLETALKLGGTLEYAIIPLLARAKLSVGKLNDVLKIAGAKPDMSDELRARILVVRGRAHSGLENYPEAMKSFNDALTADPKATGALLGLAGLAVGQGDNAKGSDLLARAIEIAPDDLDVLEFQARDRFLKQDYSNTEKFYRALIAKRPTRVAFHAGLINTLIAADKFKEAIVVLKPLLARSPKNIQLNYLRALAAFRARDFTTAYNTASTVLGIYKGHIRSMLIAGASAFAKKEYGQAAQYLQQYTQARPSHTQAKLLLGEIQLRQNRVSAATATLEAVVKNQPDDLEVLLAIGRATSMAGDLQKSGDYFQKAVKLNPDSSRAHAALGGSQIALGRTDQGIEALKRAVENDTDLSRAEIALIINLTGQKRFDEALVAVKRLQKRHPKRAIGYTTEGLLQFSKGDQESAKRAFRKALELKPDAADAAANLAAISIATKKPQEAREVLEAVLKLRPDHARILMMLAEVQLQLNDNNEAIRLFERMLEVRPEDLRPRQMLAQLLMSTRRIQKAYLVAKSTPLIHQNDPGMLEILGQTQTRLGRFKDANETIKALTIVKPNSAHAKFLLAGSYGALSDWSNAEKEFEAALSLDPNHLRSKMGLADVTLRQNKLEKASAIISDLAAEAADSAQIKVMQGRLSLLQGKPAEAIKPLSEAHKVIGSPSLTSLLAMAQMRAQGRGTGLETLRNWLKKNPRDISIRFQLANNHMLFSQYEDARKEFIRLHEIQPKNWIFLNNLADVLNRMDRFEEARPYAELAYKLAPTQPAVLDTYGVVLLSSGDNKAAAKILRAANRRAPSSPEIAYNAARALELVGNVEEARAILQEILPNHKSFKSREEAVKLLKKLGG